MSSPEDSKRKLEASDAPSPDPKALKVSLNADAGSKAHSENTATATSTAAGSSQEPQKPPRKKPGRKPNPASPSLRKEQNRAAQRAFRERKERHVRELEATIKRQADERYISDMTWRSAVEAVTYEMNVYKQLASVLQHELAAILGREAVQKIKEEVLGGTYANAVAPVVAPNIYGSGNGPSSLDTITIAQPIDATTSDDQPKSFLPSPNGSPPTTTAMLSPVTSAPSSPDTLIEPSPPEYEFDDFKSSPTDQLAESIFFDDVSESLTPEPPLIDQEMRAALQLIELAKFVRAPQFRIKPMTRHALTPYQAQFLRQPHDPRIDLVPCLQLRSRMIEHSDKYDLYELIDLLIKNAKCHGDPHDPACWEMPEEFFEKYKFLTFNHCKIKSSLYRRYGAAAIGYLLKEGIQPENIRDNIRDLLALG